MKRLKMAVVGVGALGRHHARILSGLPGVELVAVAETDPAAGRRVAADCQTRWVEDFRELFGHVEAVSIAVPTFAHLAVATEFLQQRTPVLVEKPLGSNLEQAEQIVELADRYDTLLQVGHVERFNPATQIAWKHCGPPKYIRAERVSPFPFRSTDIGVVHDLMIHDLDLAIDLVNAPVRRVEALGVSVLGEHEDTVQARLVFENGCTVDLSASRVNPTAKRCMQIWSDSGVVTVDFAERNVVCYRPSETLLYGMSPLERARRPGADIAQLKAELFGTYIKVNQPHVPESDALTDELASFVDCVANHREPIVGADEALRAMSAAERVLASVAAHQWDGHAGGAVGPFARRPHRDKLAG